MAVDEPMVVPVNTTVRMLITSNDVIHAFSVPSFGIKEDAVPGRVNETWFKVEEPGIYYGFCQELCGIGHSFMPIEVHVVSEAEFAAWQCHRLFQVQLGERRSECRRENALPQCRHTGRVERTR